MKKQINQSGFTLIEMAVVILILGLVVGSVFAFYSPQLEQKRRQVTIDRQNKVARALSDYAQRMGVLPCPAAPDDTLVSSTVLGTARTACNSLALQSGIVPFRTLGLVQDDAIDGYGNAFTYVIPQRAAVVDSTTIHNKCRTNTLNSWVSGTNRNPRKASICCMRMQAANQINVYFDTTYIAANQVVPTTTGLPGPEFSLVDNGLATATTTETRYIAYVLISHGSNGAGSYTILANPATSARKADITGNTAEIENADNDLNFVADPYSSLPGATFFDDIVLWRTQESLIREMGNNSCATP